MIRLVAAAAAASREATGVHDRMAGVTDAHASPDGRWILTVPEAELLVLAESGRRVAGTQLSPHDSVVLVEWATGSHGGRWGSEIRRIRRTRPPDPHVLR